MPAIYQNLRSRCIEINYFCVQVHNLHPGGKFAPGKRIVHMNLALVQYTRMSGSISNGSSKSESGLTSVGGEVRSFAWLGQIFSLSFFSPFTYMLWTVRIIPFSTGCILPVITRHLVSSTKNKKEAKYTLGFDQNIPYGPRVMKLHYARWTLVAVLHTSA